MGKPATFAIGDIHGCYKTLRRLLDRLPFDAERDELWLVGDLVNRGPSSLKVLRWARKLEKTMGDRLVAVLGNHDVHLLATAEGRGRPHHKEAFEEIVQAKDAKRLLAWLRRRPLLHRRKKYVLVHAGLLPEWSVAKAERWARRAEKVLRKPNGLSYLLGADAGKQAGKKLDQARRAFDVMTRIRMVTEDGELCDYTGPPDSAPPGCTAWFDVPERKSQDVVVVAGHWAALGRRLRPDLLVLDSACVYGGELTAVRLGDRRVFTQSRID